MGQIVDQKQEGEADQHTGQNGDAHAGGPLEGFPQLQADHFLSITIWR